MGLDLAQVSCVVFVGLERQHMFVIAPPSAVFEPAMAYLFPQPEDDRGKSFGEIDLPATCHAGFVGTTFFLISSAL